MHDLLRLCASSERGDSPTRRNAEEAIDVLASYDHEYGERRNTYYRVAPHPDGGIAIDLGIERTRDGIRTWETGYRNHIIAPGSEI